VAGQVYCLPDGYEVQDPSLDDIKVIALAQHAGTFAASDPMDLAMGDDANNSLGFVGIHSQRFVCSSCCILATRANL
jgi:hypothetical protein